MSPPVHPPPQLESRLSLRSGIIIGPTPLPLVPNTHTNTTANRHILIRHPHYPEAGNLLLKLFAPDSPTGGLQVGYVKSVCGIIAGNATDGWLETCPDPDADANTDVDEAQALHRQQQLRINKPSHSILPPGQYFFCRPKSSIEEPYAICPCFREWQFPHHALPPDWKRFSSYFTPSTSAKQLSASGLSIALALRDGTCRISGSTEGTQKAHIVPKSESEWHEANGMNQYHVDPTRSIDEDLANILLLRADLHINFDKSKFTMIPKSVTGDDTPQVVTHLVETSDEYEYLYHNRAVFELSQIRIELLFARLAWTVFPFIDGFFAHPFRRRVVVTEDMKPVEKWLDGKECKEFSMRGRRGTKSKKRARSTAGGGEETDKVDACVHDDIGTAADDEEAAPRDAKRQRPSKSRSTSFPSSTSLPNTPCSSLEDTATKQTHNDLKRAWLMKERAKSDPKREWEEEEAWARDKAREDGAMNQSEAIRLLEFYGAEFREEEGDQG
ncbi:hypothetical protein ACEPPN_019328 [Leptodophora sp. 'Broadleaf-Isolate-01']